MDGLHPDDERVGAVMDQHHFSVRGACGFVNQDVWGPCEKSMGNPWTPTNPPGITGPRGSHHLRNVAAAFLNEEFHPNYTIRAENLCVTPGLASAIDALAWAVCNERDGILIPQPFYNGFSVDILNRSKVRVVSIPYTGVEEYSSLEDLFCPTVNSRALEAAFQDAKQKGINPRALLILQ
ncbi:hypothetical protein BP00DRAFT_357427 [Aspergillus indologenus CBS 114.80]|uniref:Aminotransferase class I/classII large domain-containing protein n=1 Tax=Aspergillus indologenus CBS 114.80 TaxID=1450541 RepID=A0A2V5HPY8_9EURO|nr:hypothetical protein BP00DRAFT_357427 [Aspergillus indologenus CBS 114.80]